MFNQKLVIRQKFWGPVKWLAHLSKLNHTKKLSIEIVDKGIIQNRATASRSHNFRYKNKTKNSVTFLEKNCAFDQSFC